METIRRLIDRVILSQQELTLMQQQLDVLESKQASMLRNIDKLHGALSLELLVIEAFSMLIFIIYMLTSTKQTYSARPKLYIGLCVTFVIEIVVLRYGTDIDQQAWIIGTIGTVFALLASCQLLFAVYTYRYNKTLNHQLVPEGSGEALNKYLPEDGSSDGGWSSWVDTDLHEDELEGHRYDLTQDLEHILREEVTEAYNLHRRRQ